MDWIDHNNDDNNNASVCYFCVSKDGGILHKYTAGNHEIDNMAALCLEMIPPYHRFYSETIADHTFAFLIDAGFVYFAILRRRHSNPHVLSFLRNLRDDFKSTEFPPMSGESGASASTKAPLLARPSKHDRKRKDDGGDVESAEQRRSEGQGTTMTTVSSSFKSNGRERWCRQVRIILAIDAAVCVILFVIWLVVCRGLECIR